MFALKTWYSGGLGSIMFMVGLGDLKDFFQPNRFYDSLEMVSAILFSVK